MSAPATRAGDISTFLSYDVLRSWPDFPALERHLRIGTPVMLEVPRFGIRGEYVVSDIGEHGITFDATRPQPGQSANAPRAGNDPC